MGTKFGNSYKRRERKRQMKNARDAFKQAAFKNRKKSNF
jgi:hypothetical protein